MLRALRAPTRGMQVSQAARLCNLTPRAIRFYEASGLVHSTRGTAGQRLFDGPMLDRLGYIAEARSVGLSIREVQELLAIGDTEGPDAQMSLLKERCAHRLVEIEAQRRQVEAAIQNLSARGNPSRLRMAG